MTKKSRTILFLIFAFLFLLATPFFVLYSQGYRFDFDAKKLTQTGGLFFKVLPKQTEIYINGDLAKQTDFFFGSALIENLLPKSYKIEIKKEGFNAWTKTLETKEKEVVSAKNVVLFSKKYNFDHIAKNVENFWVSPDQKKMVLEELEKDVWSLKLYEPEKNLTSLLIDQNDISSKKSDLIKLEFSPNSKELYLKIGLAEQVKNYLLALDRTPAVLSQKTPLFFSDDGILNYQITNNEIFYLDGSGNIFKTGPSDFSLNQKVIEKSFKTKPETQYKIQISKDYIFLIEGKTLYQYDQRTQDFNKAADSATDLKISPDSKKLGFFNDNEVWVMFLKNIEDQPVKKTGDKVLLARFSERIENLFWLNSHYLVFNVGSQIKISEIDDRDRINVADLIAKPNPQIFWNQNDKQLYILSERTLYRSEPLMQ